MCFILDIVVQGFTVDDFFDNQVSLELVVVPYNFVKTDNILMAESSKDVGL